MTESEPLFLVPVKQNSYIAEFLGGPVEKNLPANAGDMGLIMGPGRSHRPQGN